MTLSISTNLSAMVAHKNLSANSASSRASLDKLSSGTRLTSAKEDAAALSISSSLSLDLSAMNAARQNISQASSMLQIADGGYSEISDVLSRMKTLAKTASSDQISDTDRGFIDTEYQQSLAEIDRIADSTEFNGRELLGGSASLGIDGGTVGASVETADGFGAFEFDTSKRSAGEAITIGYDSTTNVMDLSVDDGAGNIVATDSIDLDDIAGNPFDVGGTDQLDAGATQELNFSGVGVSITMNDQFDASVDVNATNTVDIVAGTSKTAANMTFAVVLQTSDTISTTLSVATSAGLGVGGTDVSSRANAVSASSAIDDAVQTINTARADIGAVMNRLDFAGAHVSTMVENTESARSVLSDTDTAMEMTKFSSSQVLVQAGVSMLAQANQQPALLLRLLQ